MSGQRGGRGHFDRPERPEGRRNGRIQGAGGAARGAPRAHHAPRDRSLCGWVAGVGCTCPCDCLWVCACMQALLSGRDTSPLRSARAPRPATAPRAPTQLQCSLNGPSARTRLQPRFCPWLPCAAPARHNHHAHPPSFCPPRRSQTPRTGLDWPGLDCAAHHKPKPGEPALASAGAAAWRRAAPGTGRRGGAAAAAARRRAAGQPGVA
jgi:hypothetical protein